MIQVNNLSGQLGNRLMRLNNGLQLSKKHSKTVKLKGRDAVTNDVFKYFDFNLGSYPNKGSNILIETGDMGRLFYKNKYDPKDLIKLKSQYKYKFNTRISIYCILILIPQASRLASYVGSAV